MPLPLTFASFALLTAGIVLLRLLWRRLPVRVHLLLIALSCSALLLCGLSAVTKWKMYPESLHASLYWAAAAGYELLVILFTLLRPRWLTSIIAAILIIPLLSASLFLPLARIFDRTPYETSSLGHNFVSVRTPWGAGISDGSGVDLEIYWRPSWAFILQRRVQGARYYNTQCDTGASFAELQPDRKSVRMNCPAAPNQPASAARSLVVKFH
jgi:hypothetical protein